VGRVGVPVVGFAVAQKECVIYPYKEGRCASLHM
jgi:hypothetical protein